MSATRPTTAHSAISSALSDDGGDPSRPRSEVSNPAPSAAASQSRRGPLSSARLSTTNSSRPQSSASRMSRSHIPSLTPHAFFRPMTSQQAQRQRGARPNTGRTVPSSYGEDIPGDAVTEPRTSMSTIPRGHYTQPDGPEALPSSRGPPSRGTEYTDPSPHELRTTAASPTSQGGNTTVRSLLGGRHGQQKERPQSLNLGNHLNGSAAEKPQKSPIGSFRSNFSLRGQGHAFKEHGHQPLSSTASSPRFDMAKDPERAMPRKGLGRNFEYFEGNTIFFLGGRLQNARDRPVNIATGIFTIIPAVLFFVFSAPWLWQNVSPAIPILFAYVYFICISSFFHGSLVDPGIFPRNLHPFPPPDPNEDPLAIGPPQNDWVMVKLATSDTAAMDVPVKYCKTCNVWRPPRCYHCRVCDNCIETLDHHCVWLNNCIGRRNYRYFFTYVSSATILCLFLIFACLGQVLAYRSQQNISFGAAVNHFRVPFALVFYGILAVPYPASLWMYHLYLTGKGETTREYLNSHKFQKADRHLPFTQGSYIKNWIAVLMRPRPPTYLHFKRQYEEGDQRFGPRKGQRQAPLVEEAQGGGMEMKPMEGSTPAFEGPSGRPRPPMAVVN